MGPIDTIFVMASLLIVLAGVYAYAALPGTEPSAPVPDLT
jgi:hypothetical protein